MTIKRGQSRNHLYGLAAIILVLCISVSTIIYLMAPSLLMKQTFNEQTEQSAINQITDNSSANSSVNSNQNTSITATQQNTSLPIKEQPSQNSSTSQERPNVTQISEEEALKLAMPYIQTYASENNRTIASVNATFYTQIARAWGIKF
ncbi:MAG TPA: hypothetical protein VK209_02215 [Candidatus Sulfotelmatobacter sp.]|nr:hypothetical protein [Candidatus Sulfotelmatobacter sp.]